MHNFETLINEALVTGYALNAAIGLQVFISALITALSAVTTGKRVCHSSLYYNSPFVRIFSSPGLNISFF